jgi:hypothetical protein
MSASLHIMGKDPASMPDQSDAEVIAFVSAMAGDNLAPVLPPEALSFLYPLLLTGVVSAASTMILCPSL